jgi:hypothetical protein
MPLSGNRRLRTARGIAGIGAQRLAEGTSRVEIVAPCFFQPSRSNHVLGWYTSTFHPLIGSSPAARRPGPCINYEHDQARSSSSESRADRRTAGPSGRRTPTRTARRSPAQPQGYQPRCRCDAQRSRARRPGEPCPSALDAWRRWAQALGCRRPPTQWPRRLEASMIRLLEPGEGSFPRRREHQVVAEVERVLGERLALLIAERVDESPVAAAHDVEQVARHGDADHRLERRR